MNRRDKLALHATLGVLLGTTIMLTFLFGIIVPLMFMLGLLTGLVIVWIDEEKSVDTSLEDVVQ